MCAECEKTIETCWAEIRDLMNYDRKVAKGPLAERLSGLMDHLSDQYRDEHGEASEQGFKDAAVAIRCELMAVRLAVIISRLPSGPFTGAPISIIIGSWAGEAFEVERRSPPSKRLRNLLYVPTAEDDPDA